MIISVCLVEIVFDGAFFTCIVLDWRKIVFSAAFSHSHSLTFKNESSYTMSAYRVHERDPVVFQRGLGLVWRNSDELPGSEDGVAGSRTPPSWLCPITFPWYKNTTKAMEAHARTTELAPSEQALLDVEVTFMVWACEWPRPSM